MSVEHQLRELHLSGMAGSISVRNQEAISSDLTYYEFLELLLQDERTARADRKIQRLLKAARLREPKLLSDFDFTFNQSINKKQIFDLATCRFLDQAEGILFLGPSGVGKSHLAQAIGLCAVKACHSVLYQSAFDLAQGLAEATANGTRKQLVNKLVKPELLIIDDFGMKTLPSTAGEDFLEILFRRHEVHSTILTSNRPLEDFGKVLHDNTSTMAILDRFLHHACIIKITGKSFRMHNRKHSEKD